MNLKRKLASELSQVEEHLSGTNSRRYRSGVVRSGLYLVQLMADIAVMVAVFAASAGILQAFGLQRFGASHNLHSLFVLLLVSIVANFYMRTYSVSGALSFAVGATRVLHAWMVTVAICLAAAFVFQITDEYSRALFLSVAVVTPVGMIYTRGLILLLIRRFSLKLECLLLIEDGMSVDVPSTFEKLQAESFTLRPDIHDPISLNFFSLVVANYDRVVIACPPERRADWCLYLQAVGCVGEIFLPEFEGIPPQSKDGPSDLPTVRVSTGPLDLPNRVLKRLLDLVVTVPLILLLSPLLLLVAIAVKLDSPGPVFFMQQRMGRSNRLFNIYKFRSMRVEKCDATGHQSTARDDDRITRVGRIIRATSIDELPQLFNVLQGDMALVGPRPHALGSRAGEDLFWHVDHRYWLRHAIKPGITGLAQVRGYRGATDHRDDLTNRLGSDLEYLTNWSIFRDLLILIRTAGVMIHKQAY